MFRIISIYVRSRTRTAFIYKSTMVDTHDPMFRFYVDDTVV